MKKTKRIQQIIVLVLIAAAIASYFLVEPVKTTLDQIFSMFATGDFAVVKDFVESYGPYAMAVSALLMIFQSLMAPLPAFLITFANANLFGTEYRFFIISHYFFNAFFFINTIPVANTINPIVPAIQ